jgi:hypothetical protein
MPEAVVVPPAPLAGQFTVASPGLGRIPRSGRAGRPGGCASPGRRRAQPAGSAPYPDGRCCRRAVQPARGCRCCWYAWPRWNRRCSARPLWLFIVGTIVGGGAMGFFRGGLCELNRLADPQRRAAVVSTYRRRLPWARPARGPHRPDLAAGGARRRQHLGLRPRGRDRRRGLPVGQRAFGASPAPRPASTPSSNVLPGGDGRRRRERRRRASRRGRVRPSGLAAHYLLARGWQQGRLAAVLQSHQAAEAGEADLPGAVLVHRDAFLVGQRRLAVFQDRVDDLGAGR